MFLQRDLDIREITGFDGYYVDENGTVYSTRKNGGFKREMSPMKLREDKDGYLEVGLYSNNRRFFRRVHRLVAEAFIPNMNNYPMINHLDGNRQNNHVSNLEWCNNSQNQLHSFRVLHRKPSITTNKPVRLTDRFTGEQYSFFSIRECVYFLNITPDHLYRLLNSHADINKWRQRDRWKIDVCNMEDVTTIP